MADQTKFLDRDIDEEAWDLIDLVGFKEPPPPPVKKQPKTKVA